MAACLNVAEARWPAVSTTYLHVKQANSSGALLFPQWALIHIMLTDFFETSRASQQQKYAQYSLCNNLTYNMIQALPGSKEYAATQRQSTVDPSNQVMLILCSGLAVDVHLIQKRKHSMVS